MLLEDQEDTVEKGLAINFVTKYDIDFMRRIEKHYNISIEELPSDLNKLI